MLLNYMTAPNVLVWSAALASSAVPHMFDNVELMRKNAKGEIKPWFSNIQNHRFVDGSIASDLPMKRLGELFNVNSFIVS